MREFGENDLADQLFSALDMKDIDEEEAGKRLDNLEQLLSISRNFLLDNPKFREYIAKHPSRPDFLDSWINPMFEAGYYLDVVFNIPYHAGLLRFLLEEIGITEWPPKNPKSFAELYSKCNNLDEANQDLANNTLEESVSIIAKLKELLQTIFERQMYEDK